MQTEKRSAGRGASSGSSPEASMMPMIDVVFLLLIFFLCATKFAEKEGVLRTWLPAIGQSVEVGELDPASVQLYLRVEDGVCICSHQDDAAPDGRTAFRLRSAPDFQTKLVETVPDWNEVREFLHGHKLAYERFGLGDRGLPVILDFTNEVSWKHVVSLVDVCAELELDNLHVSAPEFAAY